MKAVILAAGIGSRLGQSYPKALIELSDGETIISRQIKILRRHHIEHIYIVIGFKSKLIIEHLGSSTFFIYNPLYSSTNTSKSLYTALKNLKDEILWINGDVVFDQEIIGKIIAIPGNVVAVNTKECGEEEIKYSLDNSGNISILSKSNQSSLGEAVGINKISLKDIEFLKESLLKCENHDYFEKGMESCIQSGKIFAPCDISNYNCMEVDDEQDLADAIEMFYPNK